MKSRISVAAFSYICPNLNLYAMKEVANAAGKSGILHGLVGAILALLSYLLLDVVFSGFLAMTLFSLAVFAITITVAVMLGLKWRKSVGGYATLKEAFMFLFLMLILSGVINIGMELLLYHVIEPDLQKMTTEKVMEATESFMLDFGVPDAQIDETMEEMESQVQNLTLKQRMGTYVWRPFVQAFLAFILALFIRKEKPLFE